MRNTSLTYSDDKRWGITTSNKFKLNDKLDLTLAGSYQRESLTSKDNWWNDPLEKANPSIFRTQARDGWHKQWDTSFRFDWRPADWISISAGARKNGYAAFDRRLARGRAAKDRFYRAKGTEYRYVNWKMPAPADLQQAYNRFKTENEAIDAEKDTALDPLYQWKARAKTV
ncbi:TPA: TonB-dependent receptor [Neisseria bacilliformis]|uniref:Uncharacterized protein n=1 Tax=Neisseria bacilliformis ATCC BAA-1200 TaxID=888742 RepID=F2BEU5_9NEIS|nr:TonB-dependent receptor [Neisseria bacilliformis]EGF10000.1 hypothetical protein HMPREF9123_2252 [Neisseria bacilliformis ATCC BAA-1200]QMT46898.1 TonB-dependent receptor [Neisseria bacilliformis]